MRFALIRPLIAALLLTAGTFSAAQDLRTLPVRELQRLFLACDRQASPMLMSAADAAACSHAYEALLKRGFDGDFKRLLAWWQGERESSLAAAAPML